MDNYLSGSLGLMNTATSSNTTASNTSNYVLQTQLTHRYAYPVMDCKIVFHDAFGSGYGGAPARKASNADWLDKRIAEIRIKL